MTRLIEVLDRLHRGGENGFAPLLLAGGTDSWRLPGVVRSRREVPLSFRVGGEIVERRVAADVFVPEARRASLPAEGQAAQFARRATARRKPDRP